MKKIIEALRAKARDRSFLIQKVAPMGIVCLALWIHSETQSSLIQIYQQAGEKGQLEGDALDYYEHALQSRSFYRASTREPLFPFLLRAGLRLGGDLRPEKRADHLRNHAAIRHITGAVGLCLLAVLAALAWRVGGPWCGAIAATLYSLSFMGSFYAVSGLRVTTMGFLVLFLALTLLWDPKTTRTKWIRGILIGLVCGAMPLIRLSFLVVLPLILCCWVGLNALARTRGKVGVLVLEAGAYLLVSWVAVVPFLVSCKKETGDPFYVMQAHATFWRNQEFVDRPGFPSRKDVSENSYTGKRTSVWEYVFHLRSWTEVPLQFARGYWASFTRYLPKYFSWKRVTAEGVGQFDFSMVWFVLWFPGLAWACVRWKTYGFLILVALAAQLPFAFITSLNTVVPGEALHSGVEQRFSFPLVPFAALLVGIAVVETAAYGRRLWKNRKDAGGGTAGGSRTEVIPT